MGFFDIIPNLLSAAVKAEITPVAVVKDVMDVSVGENPENTKSLIQSAERDISDIFEI